jgi:hypothetical protein
LASDSRLRFDFEQIGLHSTLLIDQPGRVHWSRHGGESAMDFEFLSNEVSRINDHAPQLQTAGAD